MSRLLLALAALTALSACGIKGDLERPECAQPDRHPRERLDLRQSPAGARGEVAQQRVAARLGAGQEHEARALSVRDAMAHHGQHEPEEGRMVLERYNEANGTCLSLRIGLHAGPAVAGGAGLVLASDVVVAAPTANGVIRKNGATIPGNVLSQPRFLISTKFGIRVMPAGTMSVARTRPMINRLPRHWSLASA